MKKNTCISFLLIAFLTTGLTACQPKKANDNSKNVPSPTANTSAPAQYGKIKPAKEQIYASSTSNSEQTVDYPDILSLVPASSAIVYGTVEDYYYRPIGAIIFTFSKIKVIESYYGDYQPGDTIYIMKEGGYVTLKEYFDGFTDPEMRKNEIQFFECENMSDEELASHYIEQKPHNGIPAEVGNSSIYFLTPPLPPENKEDVFVTVGNYQGEYLEIEPNIFYKPSLESYEELKSNLSGTEEENEKLIQSVRVPKESIIAEIEDALHNE